MNSLDIVHVLDCAIKVGSNGEFDCPLWTMLDMVKYKAVSFKKDQIVALYFTMSDIVQTELPLGFQIWLGKQ